MSQEREITAAMERAQRRIESASRDLQADDPATARYRTGDVRLAFAGTDLPAEHVMRLLGALVRANPDAGPQALGIAAMAFLFGWEARDADA